MIPSRKPIITVTSKKNSTFSFSVGFRIERLIPNESYQLWTFFPDGEAVGGSGFHSDNEGISINPQGGSEIGSGFGASYPLPLGRYYFGVNSGEFQFTKKPYFTDWQGSSNSKSWIAVDLTHQRVTSLHLNQIGEIAWGTSIKIQGQLWFRDEEMPWSNGTTNLIGREIYFTGSNNLPGVAYTDPLSRFSAELSVGNTIKANCQIRAHFDGDDLFDRAQSEVVCYEITKRHAILNIEVDNLKLSSIGKITDGKTEITLQKDQIFRISGILIDGVSKSPLEDKKVNFETNLPAKPQDAITQPDGTYSVTNFEAPSKLGEYTIKANFVGDQYYNAFSSQDVKLKVIEKVTLETGIIQDQDISYMITPNKPFTNELRIKRTIRNCEGYIHWVDKWFKKKGLEWLFDEVNRNSVKEIKILITISENIREIRSSFKKFREEIKDQGIRCEMKVILDSKLMSDLHDRWIICKNRCVNLPSPDIIQRGQFSEILETPNIPPFDDWWKDSFDIMNEWNRIELNMPHEYKPTIPINQANKYEDREKFINEHIFKKLVGLETVFLTYSTLSLNVGNEYYSDIKYISHAESVLSKYKNIYDTLTNIKNLVLHYNEKSQNLVDEVTKVVRSQMMNIYDGLTESSKRHLDLPNSYSLSSIVELTYDYLKNDENSEILLFPNTNFDFAPSDSFGWVLHRVNRGEKFFVADIIVTSTNREHVNPEKLISTIRQLDHSQAANHMINELKILDSDILRKINYFSTELNRLSECIDLDIPYEL